MCVWVDGRKRKGKERKIGRWEKFGYLSNPSVHPDGDLLISKLQTVMSSC